MSDRWPEGVGDDGAAFRHAALAVRSRRRILETLRSAGGPVAVVELASMIGLHVTTTRTHVRVLEAAGLVVRAPQEPVGRGRPRYFYAPVPGETSEEGHRQLAELLAGALETGGEEGRRRAEDAGRRWAEHQVPADVELSWEQAVSGLHRVFDRLGFAPRVLDAEPGRFRVALERCPFRDAARAHPQVVCSVHLGLMRGALSRMGMPGAAASAVLQPFVAPELCLADVSGAPGPDRRARIDLPHRE